MGVILTYSTGALNSLSVVKTEGAGWKTRGQFTSIMMQALYLICLWLCYDYGLVFQKYPVCDWLLNVRGCILQKRRNNSNQRISAVSEASPTGIWGSDVARWQPRAERSFDRHSLQSSHQRRSWVSQSEPSPHRCIRLSPACSCHCPSKGASREGKDRKSKNEWWFWDRRRLVLSRSTLMSSSFFRTI